MSVRADNPLAFALGCLVGAVIADLVFLGGDLVVSVMSWRGHGR